MARANAWITPIGFLAILSTQVHAQDLPLRPVYHACIRLDEVGWVYGKLERRVYPGPPNYADTAAGDTPEGGFYLIVLQARCSAGAADVREESVRVIQLVLDSLGYARFRPLLGQEVGLLGRLDTPITGHHHGDGLLSAITSVHCRRNECTHCDEPPPDTLPAVCS